MLGYPFFCLVVGLVLLPFLLAVLYWLDAHSRRPGRVPEFVRRPWFGPVSEALVLLAALGAAYLTTADLSKAWAAHRDLVSHVGVAVCIILVAFSWYNPALWWDEHWMPRLSEDRKHVVHWEKGKKRLLALDQGQEEKVSLHRQCALWWLAFWVLVPPIWFWIEHSFAAADMDGHGYERFKDSQELARNIWLAWVAALATWHGVVASPAKVGSVVTSGE